MELLKPEILNYLDEFDRLENYEQQSYLKTVKDNAIRMALEIRGANTSKNEKQARELFSYNLNDSIYSVHEKFMTTLLFDFPQSEIKKWCKKSTLINQRVCLLLEMEDIPYTSEMNLAAALEHAILYRNRFFIKSW